MTPPPPYPTRRRGAHPQGPGLPGPFLLGDAESALFALGQNIKPRRPSTAYLGLNRRSLFRRAAEASRTAPPAHEIGDRFSLNRPAGASRTPVTDTVSPLASAGAMARVIQLESPLPFACPVRRPSGVDEPAMGRAVPPSPNALLAGHRGPEVIQAESLRLRAPCVSAPVAPPPATRRFRLNRPVARRIAKGAGLPARVVATGGFAPSTEMHFRLPSQWMAGVGVLAEPPGPAWEIQPESVQSRECDLPPPDSVLVATRIQGELFGTRRASASRGSAHPIQPESVRGRAADNPQPAARNCRTFNRFDVDHAIPRWVARRTRRPIQPESRRCPLPGDLT